MIPSSLPSPIRILLADDHLLFRENLASLLQVQPDMRLVGEAASISETVAWAGRFTPDVVVIDSSLPDGTGLEATQAILAARPAAKIVLLTDREDDRQLFLAIRAGATGYLLKDAQTVDLLKQLRAVIRGEIRVPPVVARGILEEFSRQPALSRSDLLKVTELTTQEMEVVHELARGANQREIAQRLVISEHTVKHHIRTIMSKLHLRSWRDQRLSSSAMD